MLETAPFVPERSAKMPTDITNFELHSDRRARERENYEMHKKHHEAELEARKRRVRLYGVSKKT